MNDCNLRGDDQRSVDLDRVVLQARLAQVCRSICSGPASIGACRFHFAGFSWLGGRTIQSRAITTLTSTPTIEPKGAADLTYRSTELGVTQGLPYMDDAGLEHPASLDRIRIGSRAEGPPQRTMTRREEKPKNF
jgi:hypothetical protein